MPINTPVEQQIVSSTGKALAVNRGKAAMLVADLDKGAIVLMDGKTYGGIPAAREDVQIRAGSGAITVNGKEWSTLTGAINIDIKPEGFIESAVSPTDKVLGVGDDGKIAAQLSVDYDVDTGLFSLKGKDGAVISSFNLVIPTGITPKSIALVQNPETQTPGLYLEFTFVDDDDVETKLYANMDALKDVYTAGRGISISDDRVISIDESAISGVIADDLVSEGGGLKVGDDGKLQVAVDPNGVIGVNENGVHLQFDGGLQSTVGADGKHMLELGSHASETPEYGLGDETHYGHVKLSDDADATATEAAGIAATPAAVKAVDNAAVHKTGDETISGVKTFEDVPLIKQADGSTDQVATIGDAQMLVDGTIWGKRIETDLPEDTTQLTSDMPVGAFLSTPGGGSGGGSGGGASPYNTEEWITESGTWTAPVTGEYDVLAIGGGMGAALDVASDSPSSLVTAALGGNSGQYINKIIHLSKNAQVQVSIGVGGIGRYYAADTPIRDRHELSGGETTFGSITAAGGSNNPEAFDTSFGAAFPGGYSNSVPQSARNAAFGGGLGGATVGRNDPTAVHGLFFGAGGSSYASAGATVADIGSEVAAFGNGKQGAIRLRYYDPNK